MTSIRQTDGWGKFHRMESAKSLPFRSGQVIYGSVEKINDQHRALVKIGQETVLAEMQTPLSEGGRYWFQLLAEHETVRLQLIAKSETAGDEAGINHAVLHLTKSWGLPREAQPLLRFLLQKQLPVVKEEVLQATKWLIATKETEMNLRAIQWMYTNQLPLTEDVFQAIKAVQQPDLLSNQLLKLQDLLASMPDDQKPDAIRTLLTTLQRMTSRMDDIDQTLFSLLKDWIQQGDREAYRTLQKVGGWPQEVTENSWSWFAKQIQIHGKTFSLPLSSAVLEEHDAKKQLSDWIAQLQHDWQTNRSKANEQVRAFMTALNGGELPSRLSDFYEAYLKGELPDQPLLSLDDEAASVVIAHHMKKIGQWLGLNYEAELKKWMKADSPVHFDELKPLLLRVYDEVQLPALKEQLEALIHRLTGQQLLSQSQGPIQQLFWQFPLRFADHVTDVIVRWQGRKKRSGEIDPHYCHILFYLQLERLKETIVDVRIQNSILHVTLWNHTPQIEQLVSRMQPLLKERLEACGYVLSGIKVAAAEQQQKNDWLFSRILMSHSGVDYRI